MSPKPYYRRGWTTSEYAIAKLNNRIVNTGDLAVRQLDDSRDWPSSVEEYMHMMRDDAPEELRIRFTKRGDVDVVLFVRSLVLEPAAMSLLSFFPCAIPYFTRVRDQGLNEIHTYAHLYREAEDGSRRHPYP